MQMFPSSQLTPSQSIASSHSPEMQMPGRPPKSQALPSAATGLVHEPVPRSQTSVVHSFPSSQPTTSHTARQVGPTQTPAMPLRSQIEPSRTVLSHRPLLALHDSAVQGFASSQSVALQTAMQVPEAQLPGRPPKSQSPKIQPPMMQIRKFGHNF